MLSTWDCTSSCNILFLLMNLEILHHKPILFSIPVSICEMIINFLRCQEVYDQTFVSAVTSAAQETCLLTFWSLQMIQQQLVSSEMITWCNQSKLKQNTLKSMKIMVDFRGKEEDVLPVSAQEIHASPKADDAFLYCNISLSSKYIHHHLVWVSQQKGQEQASRDNKDCWINQWFQTVLHPGLHTAL